MKIKFRTMILVSALMIVGMSTLIGDNDKSLPKGCNKFGWLVQKPNWDNEYQYYKVKVKVINSTGISYRLFFGDMIYTPFTKLQHGPRLMPVDDDLMAGEKMMHVGYQWWSGHPRQVEMDLKYGKFQKLFDFLVEKTTPDDVYNISGLCPIYSPFPELKDNKTVVDLKFNFAFELYQIYHLYDITGKSKVVSKVALFEYDDLISLPITAYGDSVYVDVNGIHTDQRRIEYRTYDFNEPVVKNIDAKPRVCFDDEDSDKLFPVNVTVGGEWVMIDNDDNPTLNLYIYIDPVGNVIGNKEKDI